MGAQRILVVDDSSVNQRLFQALLAGSGYELRCAGDEDEALEVLGAFRPDLVLVDVRLVAADGLELVHRMRAVPAGQGIKILAMTSAENDRDAARAAQVGCDAYISRPVETNALRALVAAYLGEAVSDP